MGVASPAGRGRGISQLLIQNYLNELDRIKTASGSRRESVVREAFKDLLKGWGRQQDLVFIAEHEHLTPAKDRCYVDGALLHEIRVPFGYARAVGSLTLALIHKPDYANWSRRRVRVSPWQRLRGRHQLI